MSGTLYDNGRKHFAMGDIHWKASGGDTIKVTLIDAADYTVNLSTHEYMNTNTVAAAAKVATGTLTLADPAAGVCDADDVTFTAVTGDVSEALIIWKDGGGGGTTAAGTTDYLISYDNSATGLPVTPNGGNIVVTWDSGANKIFKL
jgi:hypothetical protein